MKTRKKSRGGGSDWETLRAIARDLPGTEEYTCFGTPAFRVKKRILVRLKEDGDTIALKMDFADRDVVLQMDPETFFLTDHYRAYPMVLVRLSRVSGNQLRELLEQAWRREAPKRLVDARRQA